MSDIFDSIPSQLALARRFFHGTMSADEIAPAVAIIAICAVRTGLAADDKEALAGDWLYGMTAFEFDHMIKTGLRPGFDPSSKGG